MQGSSALVNDVIGADIDRMTGTVSHSKMSLYITTATFFLLYAVLCIAGILASDSFARVSCDTEMLLRRAR